MPSFFTTGLMATLAGSAAAHMMIDFPVPFRSKLNPFADPAKIDYSMTAPLKADGTDYPCKGYHVDFGTPTGKPTATFAPGQTYNVSIIGGAKHDGGSCQISLSYDRGKTFTVIESIIGGCPMDQHYPFTIPADVQTGDAIFSWSWHNQVGNREMYQNCAAVTIGGGAAKRSASVQKRRNNKAVVQERASAYSARPQIFVANIGNGCTVAEGAPVKYPNPGPDVAGTSAGAVPPVGNCGSSSGGGGGGGSGDGAPAPAPTTAPIAPPAPAPTSVQAPAAPAPTIPGGVFHTISTDKSAPTPTEAPAGGVVPTATAAPVAPVPTSEPAPAPPAPVPTTLQTATKASSTPAAPIATGTPDAGSGSGSGSGSPGGSGAFAVGSPCAPEGQWNCIGGTSFQRCASGTWSAVIQMAPGTKCTVGEDATLRMGAGRRVMRPRKW